MNEIFEDPEFLVQEYYAAINRIVLSGFFYATILPIGILINLVAIGLLYWAFKYAFVKHSAYPKCLSNALNSSMQLLMFSIPLVFTMGNIFYGKIFLKCEESEVFDAYNIVAMSSGVALLAFRKIFIGFFMKYVLHRGGLKTFLDEDCCYSFEKRLMGHSYNQANPITRGFDPENRYVELHNKLARRKGEEQEEAEAGD